MATIEVQVWGDERLIHEQTTELPRMLHAIELPHAKEAGDVEVQITATEQSGQICTAKTQIPANKDHPSDEVDHREALSVPIELINMADQPIPGCPLTFGVPLARGTLWAADVCQLVAGGSPAQTAQVQVVTRWPDGSVRWVRVDGVAPPELEPQQVVAGELRFNRLVAQSIGKGLICQQDANSIIVTGQRLRVYVQEGNVESSLRVEQRLEDDWHSPFLDSQGMLRFSANLGDGLALHAAGIQHVSLEEEGHQRAVVKFMISHADEGGIIHLRSTIRLHISNHSAFIKLVHRLEVVSPWLGAAASGTRSADSLASAQASGVIWGEHGEEAALLKLRAFSLSLPWESGAGEDDGDDGLWLLHDHDQGYLLQFGGRAERVDERTNLNLEIEGAGPNAGKTLAVALRHFWQCYPKGAAINDHRVTIELFPQLPDSSDTQAYVDPAYVNQSDDEDDWHRLNFWLRDGHYLLKAGMALTNEILIGFPAEGDDLDAAAAWLGQPPVVRPTIDYLHQTQALGPVASKNQSLLPAYEELVDRALKSFHEDREHFRAYGQINFGDWYGESGWSWGNNEYDPAYCAYIEFLRGGDPRWAVWGAESTRHLVDVDTINYSANPDEIGGQAMHMPGHLGGYLPPLFRSKISGTKSIPSHTWVEGPLLHYLLTGDEAARESIERTKRWLLQDRWFNHYDFNNCREAGWHIIHLCMLAGATNDRRCLNAASIIVKRVLDKQELGGGWVHMLTESHCGCGFPRCRGEAGFMVGVLLSGLKRYHALTGDEQVAQAIIGGARWLIRETYDEPSGHFRYTSCANRTIGGGFQQTQWVLEGLANAYELSGDAEIGRYVENGLKSIGLFPEGLDHLGLGKAMSQQMRYVPTLLAALGA